ncbi:MAG: HAD-IIA family hydrolase [Kosmotoga sp.]|nr:MAG: HAD-IIA family hydrolase [Kosmotoga sp.]
MDGTFFLGNRILPGAIEYANTINQIGARLVFLTNNSSNTEEAYIEKMKGFGLPEGTFDIFISIESTTLFLKREFPGSKVFLLATPEVEKAFMSQGIVLEKEHPDVIVMTFDTTLNYEKINKFCKFARKGLPYIISHPDINCPTPEGPVPDVGSFIALVEMSTGRKPDHILGKPDIKILEMLMEKYKVEKEQTLIVGDRLYTDIKCGLDAGVDTILVLTGETKKEDLPEQLPEKLYVVNDLKELLEKHSEFFITNDDRKVYNFRRR